ncbi:MAG: hypothetical protein Kow0089_12820 [Desulfobulbaceae bacterium]
MVVMSAANVIIRSIPAVIAACLVLLFPVHGEAAKTRINATGLSASKLDALTGREAPGTGNGNNDDANGVTEVDVVDIIYADQDGRKFNLPGSVFCDKSVDETYVVDNGRIVVYGENHFPVVTLGPGRGAENALGVYVDRKGYVYVLQTAHYEKPSRITVYNPAFFPVKEIDISEIPGTGNPRSMAIGVNGNMYVAFDSGIRGLLVLDSEGNFSHWLKPLDLILDQSAIIRSGEATEQEEEVASSEDRAEPDFDISELAPQLIPKKSDQVFEVFDEPGLGPVQVNDVQVDSDGNIYILSVETGKVYIYNPDEEFLYSFGEKGGSTGKLSQPQKMVIDEKKKAIYIIDATRHAILIYDHSGRFMHEFGGKGVGPGWFQYPSSATTDSEGNLIVADKFNRRVQVLDLHFEYKFPLFQVPFVYDPNEIYQPTPIRATKHYAPGLDDGQASVELTPEEEEIRLILEEASGDVI